jgi:hypothetical protein
VFWGAPTKGGRGQKKRRKVFLRQSIHYARPCGTSQITITDRSVANLIVTDCYLHYVVVLSPVHSNIWYGLESLRQNLSLFLLSFYQQVFLTEWLKAQ